MILVPVEQENNFKYVQGHLRHITAYRAMICLNKIIMITIDYYLCVYQTKHPKTIVGKGIPVSQHKYSMLK